MPSKPIAEPDPDYDPQAIFRPDGPFHPAFMCEAVRTMMRSLPLDPDESPDCANRRMYAAMLAVAALHPRDEIEVMLSVQAVAAYHAAAYGWRLGMNHHQPNGDSTRHAAMAASAIRTFDTLLKALERRQAKPLAVPFGRPANRDWPDEDPSLVIDDWAKRCEEKSAAPDSPDNKVVWTPHALAAAAEQREQKQRQAAATAQEDEIGQEEDIEGVLPGGGMIMPEHPTPLQETYIARRLGLAYRREYEDNKRQGLRDKPKLRVLRAGDMIP